MTKIYVTGPKGRLGSQLVSMGAIPIYDNILKPETQVEDGAVIINCAAKTHVDDCEGKDDRYYYQALEVNGKAIEYLSDYYKNAQIIHISTDYIFGGKRGPYKEIQSLDIPEDDLVPKTCGYGFTKFYGEVSAVGRDNVFIVRTTGLYGGNSDKSDFLKTVIDSVNRAGIRVTKELRGNQTYIPHLAEALLMCAERLQNPNLGLPKVLNIASKEVISRYEFALMIASVFGLDKNFIYPVKNSQVPGWIATRPKKGGLKTDLAQKLGLPIYTILEGLEDAKA